MSLLLRRSAIGHRLARILPAVSVCVVIGSGSMGPELAATFAATGMATTLVGRDADRAEAAAQRAMHLSSTSVRSGRIEEATIANAAIVLETIVEDVDQKRELYRAIEPWLAPEALLLTNTSSLQIGELARDLDRPERFAGLHFLKPAHLTGVVEVIPGPATAPATTTTLVELAAAIAKTPLVVQKDVPGFIWNRIQFAVLRECLHMLDAGIASAADIDAAVADGLAPRWMAAGPLATADLGGLHTFARICGQLFPHLSTDQAPPELLAIAAEAGTPLQPWTRSSPKAIAELRAAALAAGRKTTVSRALLT